MTVSTAAGKVLTGSGPQRVFGFFLTAQKETRPAGGTFSIKKVGATQNVTPTKISLTGAEAKRSFAESSFAYFSFKKSRLAADGAGTRLLAVLHLGDNQGAGGVAGNIDGGTSVSYTHLDVYKRQSNVSARREAT